MRSDRPHRAALSREDALVYIREQSGRHFHPEIAALFIRPVEEDAYAGSF